MFDVVGAEIVGWPNDDVDYMAGDFKVEYRQTNVFVTFKPVATNSPIRQSAAVVHLLSADESVLFTFGVGATSIGPNLAISSNQIQNTAIRTTHVGSGLNALTLFNDQPICPSTTFDQGTEASLKFTGGFSGELTGNSLTVIYSGESTGFITGSVTVRISDMSAVTVELTSGQDASICRDYKINGEDWMDSYEWPCSRYEEDPTTFCAAYGDGSAKDGFVANEACCACGPEGGLAPGETQPVGCTDYVLSDGNVWHDNGGPEWGCDNYYSSDQICAADGSWFTNVGFVANQACCMCGGGATSEKPQPVVEECFDFVLPNGEGWHDSSGPDFGCSNYYKNDGICASEGSSYTKGFADDVAVGATLACCNCGGGTKDGPYEVVID